MEPGLVAFMAGVYALMGSSALLIFLDYHKRSNVHKAVLFTVILIAALAAMIAAPPRLLLMTAGAVPILLLIYVSIAWRR